MKNQWIVAAAAILIVCLAAFGAAAQEPGPQGAGAEKTTQSSHASHSYNPIRWVKKDPNSAAAKPRKVKVKKKKHSD